jgi:hypothetical protein
MLPLSLTLAVTTLAAGTVVKLLQVDPGIIMGLVGGLALVGVALLAYKGFLAFRDKAKSLPFMDTIKGAMARTPAAVADPAKRARLDDLRKKYEEGIEKFRQAGKDLHSLPWYLLVGPAGSGKTEAMRHCKVGFPPGLQDCFQGAGGTMNMHWWFTNYAVVLDTAGRMFMEDSALQGGSEWREFLKMLKQSRPNAPVNGMLLVIGIDSLIKDTAEQIEGKAGHIAKQLDTIQRTLDVRFPVYVVITKCDLITGFKEFFDKIDDPQLQHQILGWSNPAPLDEPFRAESVDDHVKTIRSRLLKRRATLLMDPVHTEDPQARRTDQVDELFALPDNIAKIAPRLRRYLEIIFQAGEWSPKPLFLRGIYFTSSMRQGKALDEDLAAALGVNVDAIPGGKVYDEERSFFLRDVFMAKIFREKGLVTRATNVQKEQAGRKRLLLGAGIAAAVAMIGMTFFSSTQLKQAVRDPLATWTRVSKGLPDAAVVDRSSTGIAYFGNAESIDTPDGKKTPLSLIEAAGKQADTPIGMGFLSFGKVLDDVNEDQRAAYRAVVAKSVAGPLLNAARTQLANREVAWSDKADEALAELIAAETRARGGVPARDTESKDPPRINPEPLLAYLITNNGVPKGDLETLRKALAAIEPVQYESFGLAGTDTTLDQTKRAVDRAGEAWKNAADAGDLGELAQLEAAVRAFAASENDLRQSLPGQAPGTLDEYNALASRFADGLKRLEAAAADGKLAERSGVYTRVGNKPDQELADAAKRGIQARADLSLAALPKDIKAEKGRSLAAAETLKSALDASFGSATSGLLDRARSVKASLADPARRALIDRGRTPDERGFQAVLALYKDAGAVLVKADAPEASWLETSARVGEINAAAVAAKKTITDWTQVVTPELRGLNLNIAATSAVDLGRGGRVGAWLATLTAGLSKDGKSVREVVAAAAGSPAPLAAVPMTTLDGKSPVEASYSPAAAANVFQGWRAAVAEYSGDAKKWVVADPAAADRFKRLSPVVAEYGRTYVATWKSVLQQASVREFTTWTAFFQAFDEPESPTPADVHASLRELHEQVRRDLAAIADALGSEELRKEADAVAVHAAALVGASGDATKEKIDTLRRKLKALGPDPRRARMGVLDMMDPNSLEIEALTNALSPGVPEYWQSLAVEGMKALAREYQANADGDVARLATLARFPLVNDPSTGALTPDELSTAVKILGDLQASTGERAVRVPSGRLNEPLAALVKAKALRDRPQLAEFAEKARRLADSLSGPDGLNLISSIAGAGDARTPAGSDFAPMRGEADQWTIEGQDQDREDTSLATGKTRKIATGAGGQSLRLVFIKAAQNKVIATLPFDAPWAAARLVLTPGAEPETPGAKESAVWLVPLVVPVETDVQGTRRTVNRYMWIKVNLNKNLPSGRNWPSKQDLGL